MAYQVLARKFRPQDFSSLIGQEPIVTALRNALTEGRIAQAYIFSGIRGVGKTTAARVLAKALNCEKGPAADPCNECDVCRDITRGGDLDVIEVDAATHSKVEQVRELTESLKYGPARGRYKVVVLDEVHRLSRQAFDALLKIVEEPPPHLVFIFATTEIEAVPATLLSRCQEFHFRRVPSPVVAEHLRHISNEEGIEASDAALRLIARAGEGSVRDAVALLDQLATFGSGHIADEDAARLLGGPDSRLFTDLLAAILAGRCPDVAATAHRLEEEGWDPRHVYNQFLGYCRDALHLALGAEVGQVDLPQEEAESLASQAREAGYENLLRLLHQLLASEAAVRRSEAGALAVEIAWLRAAELPKLVAVEELLAGGLPAAPAAPAPPPRRAPEAATPPPTAARPTAGEAAVEPEPPSATPPGSVEERFLAEVRKQRPSLAALLEHAGGTSLADGETPDAPVTLRVAVDEFGHKKLGQKNNFSLLERALRDVAGEGARLLLTLEGGPSGEPAADGEPEANLSAVADDPAVQRVLDIFPGGKVENVERHEGSTE